jgi:hypothetical protein
MGRAFQNLTHPQFRDECRRAFSYLISDYAFHEEPESEDPEQYMIRFANNTTRITIRGGGFGSWTDVFFDRVDATPDEFNRDVGYPIGYNILNLLVVRGYPFPIGDYMYFGCSEWIRTTLPTEKAKLQNYQQLQIPIYAQALQDAAADILAGDFSVLSTVKVQAAKRKQAMLSDTTPDRTAEWLISGGCLLTVLGTIIALTYTIGLSGRLLSPTGVGLILVLLLGVLMLLKGSRRIG